LWIEQHGLFRWVGQLIPFFKYKPPQRSLNPKIGDASRTGSSESKYAGNEQSDSKRLKDLSSELLKLKGRYADLALENRLMKELIAKK